MTGVRRALFLSTIDRYGALAINFATLAVVSRILTPSEVGVSVVGMAMITIAMSLREFASGNFLIQRKTVSTEEIRSAFTIMLVLNVVLAAGLFSGAGILAASYDEPRLLPYLEVIAIALLVEVVAAPITPLLRREMAFGKLAVINTGGAAVAAATTIVLAKLGFSYMSLAWAWVASAVTTGALALMLGGCRSIFVPRFAGWRGMLAFGGYSGATFLLYKAYEAIPFLVLGRLISGHAAALYSRGLLICQVPDRFILGGAGAVILPAFAAEARANWPLPFLRAVSYVTAFQWPALAMIALLAEPIVGVLLGPQWWETAPLVRVMAVALLFSFSFELTYPVLVAVGALRDVFYRALLVSTVSSAVIVAAAFHSLAAVAASLLIVLPFQAFVSLVFVRRHVRFAWAELGQILRRSAVLTAATLAGPLAILQATESGLAPTVPVAGAAVVLAAFGWLAAIVGTQHLVLGELRALLLIVRNVVLRGRAGEAGSA